MSDYRSHFYGQYTTVQQRNVSLDDLRIRAAIERDIVLRDVVPHLPDDRNATIVDLGCGFGAFLLTMQELGYSNVRGIDISEQQVQIARSLGVRTVDVGDATSAFEGSANVDAIVMLDVIEHLTRNEAISTIRQCLSHLKPHGVLVLRTPNVDAPMGTVLSYGDLTHELHLNKLSALELFASLGVHDLRVLPCPPHGGSLLTRIVRGLVRPCFVVAQKVRALVAGISTEHYIDTVNMVIVARRSSQP